MVPLDIELQWVNVRQNPFKQTYSGIIQAYSGIFKTPYSPVIFRTVVYPEP